MKMGQTIQEVLKVGFETGATNNGGKMQTNVYRLEPKRNKRRRRPGKGPGKRIKPDEVSSTTKQNQVIEHYSIEMGWICLVEALIRKRKGKYLRGHCIFVIQKNSKTNESEIVIEKWRGEFCPKPILIGSQ